MPPKLPVQHHDVNPFLQKVRDFLLGRKHTLALRFQDSMATRSLPPPVLPEGPAHKLHANYYFSRDTRREVGPPEIVASSLRRLGEGSVPEVKRITPGKTWKWD